MAREILFRGFHPCENGKTTITLNGKQIKGEWVEGNYEWYHKPQKHLISDPYTGETKGVLPETVGQFTGLTDRNAEKIFENGYIIIDNKTYKVTFNNTEYILTNIFNCDTIILKNNSIRGVFVDEI